MILARNCLAVEVQNYLEEEKHGIALPKSREESLWSYVKINMDSFILLFSCINHLLIAEQCEGDMWL